LIPPAWPDGFAYHPDILSAAEASELTDAVRRIEFADVVMRGVTARRRTAHFGWLYGYESWRIEPGPPIPDFLLPVRARAAALAATDSDAFAEVLVTEYPPGAGIGWHRDAPQFGIVVGISLLSACRFRFERGKGASRETREARLEPRSAYLLTGAARTEWRHSIPPMKALRYSITFRTLRARTVPGALP
jgi:alkylated DNA repair dioxygenase AlkB